MPAGAAAAAAAGAVGEDEEDLALVLADGGAVQGGNGLLAADEGMARRLQEEEDQRLARELAAQNAGPLPLHYRCVALHHSQLAAAGCILLTPLPGTPPRDAAVLDMRGGWPGAQGHTGRHASGQGGWVAWAEHLRR